MTATLLGPLRDRNVLLLSTVISLLYCLLQIYILNGRLINTTIMDSFPLLYKLQVLTQLLTAYFVMFPLSQVILSLLTALLIGINITLLIALAQQLRRSSSKRLSIGGVGLLALASSGCPSCGITIFSILGPSYGVIGVFFHSIYIQMSIMGILLASIIYSLNKIQASRICKIQN